MVQVGNMKVPQLYACIAMEIALRATRLFHDSGLSRQEEANVKRH